MTYYLTHLKDVIGNNYIGINILKENILSYIDKLKEILNEEDFEIYTRNQQDRDNGFHITVINVADYNRLSKEIGMSNFIKSIELLLKYEIDDLEMLGIGTASKNSNIAYFIVCKSDKLDAVRTRFNLPKCDFHITLGFNTKDVFGVPKNRIIE